MRVRVDSDRVLGMLLEKAQFSIARSYASIVESTASEVTVKEVSFFNSVGLCSRHQMLYLYDANFGIKHCTNYKAICKMNCLRWDVNHDPLCLQICTCRCPYQPIYQGNSAVKLIITRHVILNLHVRTMYISKQASQNRQ